MNEYQWNEYDQESYFNFTLIYWDGLTIIFINDTANITVYIWNDIFSYYDNPVYENGIIANRDDFSEIINISNLNRKLQSYNPTYWFKICYNLNCIMLIE